MNRPLWDQWWREERSGAMDSRSFAQAMEQWVNNGQHSGGTEPASWIEFTALNAVRMRRVAKTIKMPESLMALLDSWKCQKQHWTLITESWCGDAAQTTPLIAAMADRAGVTLNWTLRDSGPKLISEFLTQGSESIPIWIIAGEDGKILGQWGPRPSDLQSWIGMERAKPNPLSKKEMAVQIQLWYARDRGKAFFGEVEPWLRALAETQGTK